mmetsp:Transcript_17328/g.66035  ORF Transcript_17328/g.66035 Transcript_17328/m.66035 type:complete len:242 (-) Transcript_17328:807-1532(-)
MPGDARLVLSPALADAALDLLNWRQSLERSWAVRERKIFPAKPSKRLYHNVFAGDDDLSGLREDVQERFRGDCFDQSVKSGIQESGICCCTPNAKQILSDAFSFLQSLFCCCSVFPCCRKSAECGPTESERRKLALAAAKRGFLASVWSRVAELVRRERAAVKMQCAWRCSQARHQRLLRWKACFHAGRAAWEVGRSPRHVSSRGPFQGVLESQSSFEVLHKQHILGRRRTLHICSGRPSW